MQAIAAMLRALEANPKDLDVLLSLGVSHVNELDTGGGVLREGGAGRGGCTQRGGLQWPVQPCSIVTQRGTKNQCGLNDIT